MNPQFKKGVLELCVLTFLEKKDCYGYELVTEISKNVAISEGTIYPLLRRLKMDGFVKTYLRESKEGPPRKYHQITLKGKERCQELRKDWNEFTLKVNSLLEGDSLE
jgi:PadR family transcriptional regulator PadR